MLNGQVFEGWVLLPQLLFFCISRRYLLGEDSSNMPPTTNCGVLPCSFWRRTKSVHIHPFVLRARRCGSALSLFLGVLAEVNELGRSSVRSKPRSRCTISFLAKPNLQIHSPGNAIPCLISAQVLKHWICSLNRAFLYLRCKIGGK